MTGTKIVILARHALLLGLALCFATTVLVRTAAANPAQLISDFRVVSVCWPGFWPWFCFWSGFFSFGSDIEISFVPRERTIGAL